MPYLYSPADIAALQAAAGRLRGPLRAETYTVLIALLAVTGLRISEAIALDDDDIDTGEGMLIVRQDKAQSFRLVPLHPTTLAALAGYQHRRDQVFPERAAPAVLVSRTGDRLTYNAVHKTFTRLAAAAGLGPRTGRCRPTACVSSGSASGVRVRGTWAGSGWATESGPDSAAHPGCAAESGAACRMRRRIFRRYRRDPSAEPVRQRGRRRRRTVRPGTRYHVSLRLYAHRIAFLAARA